MAYVARAEAIITAKNALRPGLTGAARDLQAFRDRESRAQSAIAAGVRRMALVAGGAIAGVAGYGALKDATKRFAEVDRAMTRTGITGDATAEATRRGTAELRTMAADTATLFDPAQKGLDAITASGRDFSDAMAMMPSVLKTAQASGAEVDQIANSSTALIDHMKISINGLAEAQDTLAMGGKLGKFELKDMARYLPSMLPAFKALGQTGQEGLRSLVATLQVIRSGTGTAEEAASSAQNIFSKMESEETVKNFKEMGVDLPAAMKKARKEGKNLLDVFLDLSNKALKGDLSKLPQLFKDMEVQRGMRPLLDKLKERLDLVEKLKGAKGTIDIDFLRVSNDTKANLDRFSESADRAKTALGSLAAEAASPVIKEAAARLNELGQAMERAAEAAKSEGFSGAVKSLVKTAQESAEPYAPQPRDDVTDAETARAATTAARIAARGLNANQKPRDKFEDANLDEDIRTAEQTVEASRPGGQRERAQAKLDELRRRRGRQTTTFALSDDELKAVALDQQARAPSLPRNTEAEAESIMADIRRRNEPDREAAREARKARSFSRDTKETDQKPPTGLAQKGRMLPPVRPPDLKGAIDIPVQPLDEVKTSADSAIASIAAMGPAGQTAGSQLASGFGGFVSEVQRAQAEVDRLQQKLNSLKVPSLSFGTGAGGLPVGRSMPEVR